MLPRDVSGNRGYLVHPTCLEARWMIHAKPGHRIIRWIGNVSFPRGGGGNSSLVGLCFLPRAGLGLEVTKSGVNCVPSETTV